MKVIVAKSAGFCYGVRRALDLVEKTISSHRSAVFTLGPLIHNPQAIARLEEAGVRTVGNLDDVPAKSVVMMPTHGVPKDVVTRAKKLGLVVVDATCPYVRKVHRLAEDLVRDGYQIIVLGDRHHSEVRGILSRAGDNAMAISGTQELRDMELGERVGILAQTTQSVEQYELVVTAVSAKINDVRAFNTICSATLERQHDALALTEHTDVVVVVGGRNSANTRRLAEICARTNVPTYQVEVEEELDPAWFKNARIVGVTAGASTPDWIISSVVERLQGISPG